MVTQRDRRNGVVGDLGIKAPCRCATTANITLSGLQAIDGITVVADDRVLVKDQTDSTENGIYLASSSTWQRALDFDGIDDVVNGTLVAITNGTVQANQIWQLVATNPIVIDTTEIEFTYILTTNSSNNLSTLAALASVANLSALAGLTGASAKFPKFTGAGTMELEDYIEFSNKNAIINGDFNIWQRGTSFAAVANGDYTADRIIYIKSGAMVHTITQSADVPTVAEAGRLFNYSMKIDCTTVDASIGSADHCFVSQRIEGFNFLPLAQKKMTFSTWVKATKTGVYCAAFQNNGSDRSFVSEITINNADTWEKKTITVDASPSAGNWNYENGVGLRVDIILAAGSSFQTTPNAWQTGNFLCTSNQVNGCDNTANDFYTTGWQLEEGSVATPFEYKIFQQSLLDCKRYFQKSYNYDKFLGEITETGEERFKSSATDLLAFTKLEVEMRIPPSITIVSPLTGTSNKVANFTSSSDITPIVSSIGKRGFSLDLTGITSGHNFGYQYYAGAEL